MTTLFPIDNGDIPFDVFAASFFLLSRYEEWHRLPSDTHDRPLTNALHAARHQYLHHPIVDEWALLLAQRWKSLDPSFVAPARRYRQVITVDLDNGFKYLGRPLWRTLGGTGRDLLRREWSEVSERLRVLRGAEEDPFVIDLELQETFKRTADRIAFFVLAARPSPPAVGGIARVSLRAI